MTTTPPPIPPRPGHHGRPIAPDRPPLKLALALIIVLAAHLLLAIATGLLLVPVVDSFFAHMYADPAFAAGITLAFLAAALLQGALWVASLVLTIFVIVRGRKQLRVAAIVAVVSLLASSILQIEVTGDLSVADGGAQTALTVMAVLGYVIDGLIMLLGAVAVVMLIRAYRIAAREDAERPAAPGLPAGGTGLGSASQGPGPKGPGRQDPPSHGPDLSGSDGAPGSRPTWP